MIVESKHFNSLGPIDELSKKLSETNNSTSDTYSRSRNQNMIYITRDIMKPMKKPIG